MVAGLDDSAPPGPTPGMVLVNKYRVDRVIGRGGMGYVVAATHLQLDEPVAMKFLHGAVAKDSDLVTRFVREAKAALKIRSEHVVKILDVGTLPDGGPFMVMEYLEGQDLDALLRKHGPQPVMATIDMVLQACEALAEAHVQGMVHRDLKPANLFVARNADGTPLVKVLDFGISKVTGSKGADLGQTRTNASLLGSPLYMAPEQMRSLRDVDPRTDIWALGVIMHEMLRGTPPFNGNSLGDLCATILTERAPSLLPIRRDIPPVLDAVILRCLEKDPNARFPNVGDLALALGPFASPKGRTSVASVRGVFTIVKGGTTQLIDVVDPSGILDLSSSSNPQLTSLTSPSPNMGQMSGNAPIPAVTNVPATTPSNIASMGERSPAAMTVAGQPPQRTSAPPPTTPQSMQAAQQLNTMAGWGQTHTPSTPPPRVAAVNPLAVVGAACVALVVVAVLALVVGPFLVRSIRGDPSPTTSASAAATTPTPSASEAPPPIVSPEPSAAPSASVAAATSASAEPTPSAAPSASATATATATQQTAAPTQPTPPKGGANCSPAYEFDKNGKKKWKPECL